MVRLQFVLSSRLHSSMTESIHLVGNQTLSSQLDDSFPFLLVHSCLPLSLLFPPDCCLGYCNSSASERESKRVFVLDTWSIGEFFGLCSWGWIFILNLRFWVGLSCFIMVYAVFCFKCFIVLFWYFNFSSVLFLRSSFKISFEMPKECTYSVF